MPRFHLLALVTIIAFAGVGALAISTLRAPLAEAAVAMSGAAR